MILGKRKKAEQHKTLNKINMSSIPETEIVNNAYLNNIKSYRDYIFPSGIDVLHPEYINVDGAYTATLLCMEFPYLVDKVWLDKIINFDEGVELFIYHEPKDKNSAVREITTALGFTKYKMQAGGSNQVDSGIQENALYSSTYMKERLSKGDEFFYINVFIKITADSPQLLETKVRRVENELAGMTVFYRRADFIQLEAYLSALPLNRINKRIKKETQRNILSSGLKGFYPFTSSSLSDPEGMFMGINAADNSQIILDIFDTDKYSNANMVICGMSGSGKTFTTQMLAGRFRMQKIPVMLICPLKGFEYANLCEHVGGNFFKFAPGEKNCINIMEIRPTKQLGREKASYLADKVQNLQIAFSLIVPSITEPQLKLLDAPLKRVYENRGITMDNASIYESIASEQGIKLKPRLKEMPTLGEVQAEIKKIPQLSEIADLMEPFVTGSLSFFNGQTNVDLENMYTVADISDMPKNMMAFAMFIILDIYWDRIKRDRTQKKAVILDELWKLIGSAGNAMVAEYVLEIFKIIRGYGGAAIGTTQDIADFMMLEEGKYGKGIVNASSIKIIQHLEPIDAAAMAKALNFSEEEHSKVEKFKRGEGLLYAGSNHLTVKFKAFATEERLINTDRKKLLKYEIEEVADYGAV